MDLSVYEHKIDSWLANGVVGVRDEDAFDFSAMTHNRVLYAAEYESRKGRIPYEGLNELAGIEQACRHEAGILMAKKMHYAHALREVDMACFALAVDFLATEQFCKDCRYGCAITLVHHAQSKIKKGFTDVIDVTNAQLRRFGFENFDVNWYQLFRSPDRLCPVQKCPPCNFRELILEPRENFGILRERERFFGALANVVEGWNSQL